MSNQKLIDDLKNKISRNKSDDYSWSELGRIYYINGVYDKALPCLNAAIKLVLTNGYYYSLRGNIYYELKEYQNAVPDYLAATQLNPKNSVIHFNLAKTYDWLGRAQDAIDTFTTSLTLNPNVSDCYHFRGKIYQRSRQYDFAIEDYTKAINLNPKEGTYMADRGFSYFIQQKWMEAEADYIEAIRQVDMMRCSRKTIDFTYTYATKEQGRSCANTQKASYYSSLSNVYYMQQDWQRALDAITSALQFAPYTAEYKSQRGAIYDVLEQYTEAIEEYEKAAELEQSAKPLTALGDIYQKMGDSKRAAEYYVQASVAEPTNIAPFAKLSQLYLSMGKNDEAIKSSTSAITIDPTCATSYNNRGDAHYELGQYLSAISDYNTAIKLKPGNDGYYASLAKAYTFQGQHQLALSAITKAVEIKPSPSHYNNMAAVYTNLGLYAKVVKLCTKVTDSSEYGAQPDQTEIDLLKRRGYAYYKLGEYSEAIDDFTKAISISQDDVELSRLYTSRGAIYGELKQYDIAVEDLEYALRLNPNNGEAYSNTGTIYDQLKQYEEALKKYDAAARLNPNVAIYHANKGLMCCRLGLYGDAIKCLTMALSLEPDTSVYLGHRGNAYYQASRYQDAINDYIASIQQDDSDASIWNMLGLSYYKLEKYEEALNAYDTAIAISPTDAHPNYYHNRGEAYYSLKMYYEAIGEYNEAIKRDLYNPNYYAGRGNAYDKSGNNACLKDWSISLGFDPSSTHFYKPDAQHIRDPKSSLYDPRTASQPFPPVDWPSQDSKKLAAAEQATKELLAYIDSMNSKIASANLKLGCLLKSTLEHIKSITATTIQGIELDSGTRLKKMLVSLSSISSQPVCKLAPATCADQAVKVAVPTLGLAAQTTNQAYNTTFKLLQNNISSSYTQYMNALLLGDQSATTNVIKELGKGYQQLLQQNFGKFFSDMKVAASYQYTQIQYMIQTRLEIERLIRDKCADSIAQKIDLTPVTKALVTLGELNSTKDVVLPSKINTSFAEAMHTAYVLFDNEYKALRSSIDQIWQDVYDTHQYLIDPVDGGC